MGSIHTVLIANRGEIACRVMKTARAMGLRTVAVFSDADRNAQHVRLADTAVHIGGSAVAESYLNIDAIIAAAKSTGANAVHPGYGFLSENTAFAAACQANDIVFIGPSSHAIEVMGDKARAKRAMIEAGVPCIPGYQDDAQDMATLVEAATAIGMPVMVKAAAGGGGRGMRLVTDASQLESAIELAQSEALNAFGSQELIIEKAVLRPRHVEIQVFADAHGNTVHLGERDCSIQRRHQKVVEEAPCPVMTPALRARMGKAAIEAAEAVNYVGAGTVEFLLDEAGDFYFLEMNTRLQVEHPVTELVTGFDLVEWQIRVARGEPLPALQEDIDLFGHAVEVRLYAEEPERGFLPSTGPVKLFNVPTREGLRVDTGIASGDEVSPFYDAMVAKVIGYGETREDAIARLVAGLADTALLGVGSNRDFLLDVLTREDFVSGAATTAFIGDHYGDVFPGVTPDHGHWAAAAALQHVLDREQAHEASPWVSCELLDWASTGSAQVTREYHAGDQTVTVVMRILGEGDYRCAVESGEGDETEIAVQFQGHSDTEARLVVDGHRRDMRFNRVDAATLMLSDNRLTFTAIDQLSVPPELEEGSAGGQVRAPMHGQLLSIDVDNGATVEKGQRIAVLEAMKMQHEITAPVEGVVTEITGVAGKQTGAGDLIMVIEAS